GAAASSRLRVRCSSRPLLAPTHQSSLRSGVLPPLERLLSQLIDLTGVEQLLEGILPGNLLDAGVDGLNAQVREAGGALTEPTDDGLHGSHGRCRAFVDSFEVVGQAVPGIPGESQRQPARALADLEAHVVCLLASVEPANGQVGVFLQGQTNGL